MRLRFAVLLAASAAGLAITATSAPAQDMSAPATVPDTATASAPVGERGPGVDSANAVNPAPGVTDPYVGHSQNAFYGVEQRIARVETRVKTQLTGTRQRKAMASLRSIKAELATQEARHGDVRDWDREHLNTRLDTLEGQYGLSGAATPGR